MWTRAKLSLPLLLGGCVIALSACDDDEPSQNPQEPVDRMAYWEQQATATAEKNAAFELGCQELNAQTLDRNDAVMVKWYSIGITGCGKKVIYDVTCANSECDAERKGEITQASDAPAPAPDSAPDAEPGPAE